ncbi:epoxyqueuosine reductase QueH [Patescibacteria group bacterium]|nr:epoxyqueuosine reductase QueH [Patescibacteria group bacterium]
MNKPPLLLHACCGVCSAYVPERLMPDFDVTIYYENSNIYPSDEFYKRQEAAKIMAQGFKLPFIEAPYKPEDWFKDVRGLKNEPERGKRCDACIYHRLDKTFKYAKENGFFAVATTLSVSRRKDINQVNAIGYTLAEIYGLEFIGRDWKKQEGEKISQQRAKATGIYRQEYCGCVYSKIKLDNHKKNLAL